MGSMSDTTNSPNPADRARSEALDWLAGQFRWETLLSDLHELAEKQAAPVVELERRTADRSRKEEKESAA